MASSFIGMSKRSQLTLEGLPNNCLTLILERLDTQDICHVACVNKNLNTVSSTDFIWGPKLPANYESITRIFTKFPKTSSKKDIYSALCQRNYFDKKYKVCFLSVYICISLFLYYC